MCVRAFPPQLRSLDHIHFYSYEIRLFFRAKTIEKDVCVSHFGIFFSTMAEKREHTWLDFPAFRHRFQAKITLAWMCEGVKRYYSVQPWGLKCSFKSSREANRGRF
jgi:hypothetical protein